MVPVVIALTCENAVAAAKAVVGADPTITSIEFHFGSLCPPNARCALTPPNVGYVIFNYPAGGLREGVIVSVRADETGKVTAFGPAASVPVRSKAD